MASVERNRTTLEYNSPLIGSSGVSKVLKITIASVVVGETSKYHEYLSIMNRTPYISIVYSIKLQKDFFYE